MSDKKIIKWAIMGLGKISKRMRRVIESVDGCTVEACVSSSKERAIEYSEKFNIKHALTYDELEQNPELVDAVYICTHMNMHTAPAIRYLNKKLPVLVEKTFAMSVKDAKAMFDAASENDTLLMEAMWTRFLPCTLKLLDILENGEVGKIKATHGRFEVGIDHRPGSRVFKQSVGGGSLLDVGIYPVTYTHLLLGVPNKIDARSKMKSGIDMRTEAILHYDGGVRARVGCSHEFLTLKEYFIIETENALIKLPRFYDGRKIVINYKDGRKKETIKDFGKRGKPDGFIYEIEHFSDLIRNNIKESPVMTRQVTLEVQKIMEDILIAVGYYSNAQH